MNQSIAMRMTKLVDCRKYWDAMFLRFIVGKEGSFKIIRVQSRLEAIAFRLEAIAFRLEAIAILSFLLTDYHARPSNFIQLKRTIRADG